MIVEETSLAILREDASSLIARNIETMAVAMKEADPDEKTVCRLVVTIEMIDDPGSETKARTNTVQVKAKLNLPDEKMSAHKILWDKGQLALL